MTVYTDKISRSEDSPPRGLGTRAAPPGLAGRPRPQRNTSALRRASSVLVTRMPEHGRRVLGSALPTPPGTPGGRGELPAAVPVLADIAAGVSVPGPRSGGPRPGRTAGTGLRRPAGWRPVVQPQDVARGPARSLQTLRGTVLPASRRPWWLQASLGLWPLSPISAAVVTARGLFPNSLCLPLMRTPVIPPRAHPHNPGESLLRTCN